MEEIKKPELYNWLYVKKDGTWNCAWNQNSVKMPRNGDPENYDWIDWTEEQTDGIRVGRPLPPDAGQEGVDYIYDAELNDLVKQ